MAKLPSFEELGQINARNTRNPAEYYDFFPTANAADRITSISKTVGRGTEAIGQGIARLGSGIGAALSKVESSNDQLNGALANSSWAASKANLDYAVSQSTDPVSLWKYPAQYNDALTVASSNLNDKQKQLFMAFHGDDLQKSFIGVAQRSERLLGDKARADAFTNLSKLRDSQLKTDDPNEHSRAIHDAGVTIDALADRGYITRLQAAEAKNTWVTDFATAWVGSKPPGERLRILDETLGQQQQSSGARVNFFSSGAAERQRIAFDPAHPDLTIVKSANGLTANVNRFAAPAFQGFIRDLESRGYNIHDLGGYNYRNKRGGNTLSEHAFGNAIDINPSDNSFGGTKTNLPPDVSRIAAKWGLSWGGDWQGKKDWMHFEWTGGQQQSGPVASAMTLVPGQNDTKADLNFNPGNIHLGDWAKAHGGISSGVYDQGDELARFQNPEAGFKAMADLALEKYNAGKTTADQLIAANGGWTPGNHTGARDIAARMGLGPNDDLRLTDPVRMRAFQKSLAIEEGAPRHVAALQGNGGAPQGKGGVDTRLTSLLPRDKLVHMQRQAENDFEHRTRTERMAADQERAKVRSLVSADIQSIQTTGVPVQEISPERVAASLGDPAAAEFQVQRDMANRFHTKTFDFDTLPSDQLEARAESLRPPDGDPYYPIKTKYYDAAWKLVRETQNLRQADPAGAVGGFPDVRKTMEGASLESNPESYRAVGHARLAAQGLIGILPDQQSPISREEAQRLWARVNAVPEDRRGAEIKRVDQLLRTAFGDDGATAALRYTLHSARVSHAVSEQAVAILRRLAAGRPMTADQASGFDKAAGQDASEAAVSGVGEPRQNIGIGQPSDRIYRGRGAQPHPEQPARGVPSPPPAKYPTVTDEDIDILRKNPERVRRNFDHRYGPGSADTVLRRFQEAPVQ